MIWSIFPFLRYCRFYHIDERSCKEQRLRYPCGSPSTLPVVLKSNSILPASPTHLLPEQNSKMHPLVQDFKTWITSGPLAICAFIWLLLVVVDGAILFMCMTGMLQLELTADETLEWTETTSQIMNFLFTGMAFFNTFLFPFPGGRLRTTYLYLFDFPALLQLRGYNDTERASKFNVGVVIILLLYNCLIQYLMAYFIWFYGPETRPILGIVIPLVSSFIAGGVGGFLEGKLWVAVEKKRGCSDELDKIVENKV